MKTKILIPLLAGLAMLCACKGKISSETADSTSKVFNKARDVSSKNDTIRSSLKLVKTADMHFKVKNVQQTGDRITALTASFNGTVIHHIVNSTTSNSVDIRKSNDSLMRITVLNTTAEMTVKIPPANMENYIGQVAHLGIYINNSRMDINDKSLDYLSTRLKLQNSNELVAQQKKGETNAKDPDNLLAFKNNMVDQQIGNRKIDDSVKNSIVTLSFYESNVINRELIANDDLSAYNPPFFKRLSNSFENGWEIFVDVLVGLANFWVLIPTGIAIWMTIRYYKRKRTVDLAKS
jgi:Domain of unknown function (DUF4349)